jgi:phage terminase Nu1 subunit (DNA packaging protein)
MDEIYTEGNEMADKILKEIDEHYPDELITRAEYAVRRGVAARTIGKYVQRGVIPLHDDRINPDEADAALELFLIDPLGSGRPGDPPEVTEEGTSQRKAKVNNNSYTEARTQEKNLKIELLELEVALKKGEMVLTKDVELAAFNAAREIRDRMLNIPDRVAAIIAAETDEVTIRDMLTGHIEGELKAVSDNKIKYEDEIDGT